MSREKKFRVWDKVTEEFLYSDKFPSMWLFFKEMENRGIRHWEAQDYTGLKDKNGKEIYEGDIIRFYFTVELGVFRGKHTDKKREEYTEMIDVVEFIDVAFYFTSDIGCSAYANRYNNYCEVIGNIHSNPELLETENE